MSHNWLNAFAIMVIVGCVGATAHGIYTVFGWQVFAYIGLFFLVLWALKRVLDWSEERYG